MHSSKDINVQTHYLRMGISLSEFINILCVDEKMPKGWGVSIFGEKKCIFPISKKVISCWGRMRVHVHVEVKINDF